MPDPMPAPARYGFVGVGTMSSAIVRGLCTLPFPPPSIVLSPRGAEKAAALAAEFGPQMVRVASSNQEVVDSCCLPQTETYQPRGTSADLPSADEFGAFFDPPSYLVRREPIIDKKIPKMTRKKSMQLMQNQHSISSSFASKASKFSKKEKQIRALEKEIREYHKKMMSRTLNADELKERIQQYKQDIEAVKQKMKDD